MEMRSLKAKRYVESSQFFDHKIIAEAVDFDRWTVQYTYARDHGLIIYTMEGFTERLPSWVVMA